MLVIFQNFNRVGQLYICPKHLFEYLCGIPKTLCSFFEYALKMAGNILAKTLLLQWDFKTRDGWFKKNLLSLNKVLEVGLFAFEC